MSIFKKILGKLNGLHYRQEYLCTAMEKFEAPLHVYIIKEGKIVADVSKTHLFIGYHPVIIGIKETGEHENATHLYFTSRKFTTGEQPDLNATLARLDLKPVHGFAVDDAYLNCYVATSGSHRFVNRFHQAIQHLNNKLYNRKQGNVYLEGNLYNQVEIAYAIPRKISLITVGADEGYNLFPTDLHGEVGQYYLISLRKDGMACKQVVETGKIVLSDMETEAYQKVYALGKNHMQPLKPKEQFDLSERISNTYRLPIPKQAISYRELQLLDTYTCDIHKLMLFKIVTEEEISNNSGKLSHIHNTYATWRFHQGISTNYYLR